MKRNHKRPACRKATLKHINLNKVKRQRNIQQIKEHDKCPLNQTKKEEIEVTRRRGGIKMDESSLASNQFPMCSPQSGTFREVHGVT